MIGQKCDNEYGGVMRKEKLLIIIFLAVIFITLIHEQAASHIRSHVKLVAGGDLDL